MSLYATLTVSITSYWHAGTGRGTGLHVDALTHTDRFGLPCLPGRTLKGMLRDAVQRAEHWGHLATGTEQDLFGSRNTDSNRLESQAGKLSVSDAVLPENLRAWLGRPEQAQLREGLFRTLSTTAVARETGVAEDKSLRSIQVAVPLELSASLTLAAGMDPERLSALIHALPLIQAVGASRSRGFGRCGIRLAQAAGGMA